MAARDPIDPNAATMDSGPGTGAGTSDPHAATVAHPSGPAVAVGAAAGIAQLAHFRIERRLGKGGMGEVYLATDLALDRPVAVKLIARDVASDPALRQRFLREARAQARIQHPNVCHIYYVGEQDGRLFFAMEYVEGESLQERLDRQGKLPPGEVVELCRQAALGLREAWRHGFTHRDVKPSNLMVDRHGVVKVVDFGLVKHAAGDGATAAASATGVTRDGAAFVGTPLYIAPEQAKGDPVDFRADVYALGATMHHLVAGTPPFRGDTTFAIISRHLVEPRPKLADAQPRWGPSPLDALCDRMMAKRPGDRFASYDDLLAAMRLASPATSPPAGLWVRGFALLLDMSFVALLMLPLQAIFGKQRDALLFLGTAAAYQIFFNGRLGRTLGKMALDLEVAAAEHAGPPGYARAAKRWAVEWGLPSLGLVGLWAVDVAKAAGALSEGARIALAVPLVVIVVAALAGGAILTALRPDRRAPWDVLAGTVVRYRGRGARSGTAP
jgi:uncharacterized RDD family membrane protein YckC